MVVILNDDLLVIKKTKELINDLDVVCNNVPNKIYYNVIYIMDYGNSILENTVLCNYNTSKDIRTNLYYIIMTKLDMFNYILDIYYNKKYISSKVLYKKNLLIIEIKKLLYGWIYGSKDR